MFNTVINTLVDTITKCYPHLGYSLTSSRHRTNLLQYADDTSLIADVPSSCKTLLGVIEDWLTWSGMKANLPKCVSLAIRASSGKPYNPDLTLDQETIPYIVDTETRFSHSTNLSVQNQPLKDNTSRAPRLWSFSVATLPERVFKFALNSLTDTLPHNANLHLWRKLPSPSCKLCGQRQTLLHVLNACP